MWIIFWHAILWVPKLLFYVLQRIAVWSGTLYLFKQGKYGKVYYVLGAVLYITSWVLIILLVKQTLSLKFSDVSHWFAFTKKVT